MFSLNLILGFRRNVGRFAHNTHITAAVNIIILLKFEMSTLHIWRNRAYTYNLSLSIK